MDSFGVQSPPSVPSRLITISAEKGTNTVTQLKYCVSLRGVIPNDMELFLIRSLEDGKYYFIVYTLYVLVCCFIIVSITTLVANESIPAQIDIGIVFKHCHNVHVYCQPI